MRDVFFGVLSLSVSGALLIALLWPLTRLLGKVLGRRWQYYIWLLAAARLLLPLAPESGPLGRLWDAFPASIGQEAPLPAPPGEEGNAAPAPPAREGGTAAGRWLPLLANSLWVLWLAAAFFLLIRKITLYQSFARYIRAGQCEVADPGLLNLLGEACGQVGVKRPPDLCRNGLLASPLLLGLARCAIVLPQIPENREELRLILLHELVHLRRRDILYKWLMQLALCLHWFNPFVYRMAREANRACELSCDAAVLRLLDGQGRRRYGEMLLHSLDGPGAYREGVAAVTLGESARQLKERLAAIKRFRAGTRPAAVPALLLSACLLAGGYSLGVLPARGWADLSGGAPTGEGLPVMSAPNRDLYDTYLSPVAITGLLGAGFTPEDTSALLAGNGNILQNVFTALNPQVFSEYTGAVPAALVEDALTAKLPVYQWMVRDALAGIYDGDSGTYALYGDLGGGPNTLVVTGARKEGKLLAIRYTWYYWGARGDAQTEGYEAGDSGEVILRLTGDGFMYLSNQLRAKA